MISALIMTEQVLGYIHKASHHTAVSKMKQTTVLIALILLINECFSQTGFPKQFQTTLNISSINSWSIYGDGLQKLLYDYENLRVRMDVQGWREKQNETYMIKYKPEGAEADSVSKTSFVIGNRSTIKSMFSQLHKVIRYSISILIIQK